jgi:colanic acid/amylovoran biosynthesis glycosyltransferase
VARWPIFGAVAQIAYLLNQYPAISHSFILGEVRALRRRGIELPAYSIHRSDPRHLLAREDREEHEGTYALRPVAPRALARAHLATLLSEPRRYLRVLWRSLARSGGAPRTLLWQLFYFGEAVPLWREIRRARARHVHAHFAAPAADVAMIVAELGDERGRWSWSFSAHGADIQETDQRLLAAKIRDADAVICVSDFGRSQLMLLVEPEHWGKLRVLRCGVDTRAFAPAARAARARPSGGGPLRVLSVGRLVAVKGHAVLLEAIAAAEREGVALELTLVGDGPLRAALERRARALGIERRVRFTGAVGQDAIVRHYHEAQAFCLPSLREGVPVVLMEAMACELPVVATGINGIPELVQDGVSGILVAPGSPQALASALARLAGDRSLRLRLGRAARARVVAQYDLERNAAALAELFETIARRPAGTAGQPAPSPGAPAAEIAPTASAAAGEAISG